MPVCRGPLVCKPFAIAPSAEGSTADVSGATRRRERYRLVASVVRQVPSPPDTRHYRIRPQDLRCLGYSDLVLRGRAIGVGIVVVVESQRGGQYAIAVRSDSVEAGSGDLGDQAVAAEFGDEPGDPLAAAVGFFDVVGWSLVEAGLEVVVAEGDDG